MTITDEALIAAAVEVGLIEPTVLPGLRIQSRRERQPLLDLVSETVRMPSSAFYRAVAEARGLCFLDEHQIRPDIELVHHLPAKLLRSRLFLPARDDGGGLVLVLSDPDDQMARDAIRRLCADDPAEAFADPEALRSLIEGILTGATAEVPAGDPVALMDEILWEAYLYRASDIHVEPERRGVRVRLRVDGRLVRFRRSLSSAEGVALLNRIKALAELDIAEHRIAQDGAMTYHFTSRGEAHLDIRVATVPTRWGERATLRLFGTQSGVLSLANVGMPEDVLAGFRSVITRPHGLILLTGPTGSGKTTTLYAALRELDSERFNILTVEDPVEQVIEGLTQVQVGPKLDFAQALRSFLRHDPDVILVGEIRDRETAEIALKASLTGHLVLSTLHTNDAAGAVTRLSDIGCDRFLIAATLIGAIAQRLVRRLCPRCCRPHPATVAEAGLLGTAPGTTVHRAVGCSHCMGTGYRGRIGLFGAIWVDADLSQRICAGAEEAEIRRHGGGRTLSFDAREKVLAGETSIEEVATLALRED